MATVRPLTDDDYPQWLGLWAGYLRFYRERLPEEITQATFNRLVDPENELKGLVAESDGRLLGFAHYLFHPSTWSLTGYCYLEDLFVDPDARGQGAGRALIEGVYAAADKAGSGRVYWMTQEFNADARALYDTLGHRTSFIKYQR
ncbi:MAG TPA: GNAT family N-acetyltransferase [Alphaproteobacteria bacterium]|jgi:GNAT superfamily N-acetyltransferase|nr:GNAT family N-acetyltransferase [Alphaproteobacteria bacterium]